MHDPDKLLILAQELADPLELYLKWRVICDRYDRGKSSKLAECIQKIPEGSYAAKEARALASDEYKTYLDEFHNAEKEKVKAQVEYESLKCQFDALQSVLSYERETMKRLG